MSHLPVETPPATFRHGPRAAERTRPIELPEYLPARMLNEFVYCPRLFFYEWVEQLFAESADTVEGSLRHEKLERKQDPLPPPDETNGDRIHSRSVMLASDTHKLIATIDLVEGTGRHVTPVDYKKGRPRDGDDGPEAWDADRVQVGAQALVLRDNGYECTEAVLYYDATKQRVRVPIDETLTASVVQALADARALATRGRIPPPLIDSPKCPGCSLVSICLPDETAAAMRLRAGEVAEQLSLFAPEPPKDDLHAASDDAVRRLVPARDDLRPLYVTGHGLTVGKSSEVLQIKEPKDRGKAVQVVRVNEISQVNVFGNVQMTATAVQGLCWADKPIAHFSYGGWFYGLTHGLGLKNVFLRKDQFRRAEDPAFCLRVARQIVASKIRNQRTMLQRNHVEPRSLTLKRLRELARDATEAGALDELLGIEGAAACMYFQEFGDMLKLDGDEAMPALDLEGRNRRPPRDPVNALLSFAYSLLVKDLTITCNSIGFDLFVGFYHQPRFGRPALALDLMEMFRPLDGRLGGPDRAQYQNGRSVRLRTLGSRRRPYPGGTQGSDPRLRAAHGHVGHAPALRLSRELPPHRGDPGSAARPSAHGRDRHLPWLRDAMSAAPQASARMKLTDPLPLVGSNHSDFRGFSSSRSRLMLR